MKSKDQRASILLTCGLIILDMNAGNGLAISLSVYLRVSKNDMLKKKKNKKQNKKQNDQEKRKKNLSSEGSRTSDLRRKRATRYPLRHGHFKC